jgi:hypothetical protein
MQKLTDDQVREIRSLYWKDGAAIEGAPSHGATGRRFGVDGSTVQKLVTKGADGRFLLRPKVA